MSSVTRFHKPHKPRKPRKPHEQRWKKAHPLRGYKKSNVRLHEPKLSWFKPPKA